MPDWSTIRARALANGQIVDSDVVAQRVSKGDLIFAQRVILAALVKSSPAVRLGILKSVNREGFTSVLGMIFDWSAEMLQSHSEVEPETLYPRMEGYVLQQVAPEYVEMLDEVLTRSRPTAADVDQSISWLRNRRVLGGDQGGEDEAKRENLFLASLIESDDVGRERLMAELARMWEAEMEPVEGINRALFLQWVVELIQAKGRVDKEDLRQKLQDYIRGPLLSNYTAIVDHVLALEVPDREVLTAAVTWLGRRRRIR